MGIDVREGSKLHILLFYHFDLPLPFVHFKTVMLSEASWKFLEVGFDWQDSPEGIK